MPAQNTVDRRIRRSRSALEAALLDLIAEVDLNQISVSDVTGRADVHRTTFYEHYTDVHDLAASACARMFDQLITAAGEFSAADAKAEDFAGHGLAKVFAHVAEHRRLYHALLGADGSAKVINHLLERTAESVRDGLSGPGTITTDASRGPAATFIAGALLGTITDWLRRDCPENPEQISAAIMPYLYAIASVQPG